MKKIVVEKRVIIIISIVTVLLILLGILIFFNYKGISKERVKQIIYDKTKFKKGSIDFRNIELKNKNYNVEISYNGIIFNFVINSKSGKIIKNNFDDYPDKEYKGSGQFDYISKDDAKKLVVDDLGTDVNDIDFKSVKFEKGNYSAIYTIKVDYNDSVYEYTVDGISGEILPGYTTVKNKKQSSK